MINRSKAEAKAKYKAKAKFKAKAKGKSKSLAGRGSGSRQGKIPGQPTKLGDGPLTQLKNEKAVEENLAKVQLDENTTPKPKPEEKRTSIAVRTGRNYLFKDPCRICNVFGHWTDLCPYLKFVPYNVTKVGKGYEIHEGRRGKYAAPIYCLNCMVPVEHEAEKCPYDR